MQRPSNTTRRDGSKNTVRLQDIDNRSNRSQNTGMHGVQNTVSPQIPNQGQSRALSGNFIDPYMAQQSRLQDSSIGNIRTPRPEPPLSAGGVRNEEGTTFFQSVLTPMPSSGTVPVSVLANQGSLTHQLLAHKSTANPATTSTGSQSRRSSSHSLQNISEPTSEADSDDPEDEDASPGERGRRSGRSGTGPREKRREAHTLAEQKRRDAIKLGYSELEKELPHDVDKLGNQKDSKARILQKSIEYVNYLETKKKQQAEELEKLKNEFLGLQIMKAEYEKMAVNMRGQADQGGQSVPDEVKFQVFQRIMDNLFQTYDARVVTSSFAELSGTAFTWLEECCTPAHIKHITAAVLNDFNKSYAQPRK